MFSNATRFSLLLLLVNSKLFFTLDNANRNACSDRISYVESEMFFFFLDVVNLGNVSHSSL